MLAGPWGLSLAYPVRLRLSHRPPGLPSAPSERLSAGGLLNKAEHHPLPLRSSLSHAFASLMPRSVVRRAWCCHCESSREPAHRAILLRHRPANADHPLSRRWRSRMARAGPVPLPVLDARGVRFRSLQRVRASHQWVWAGPTGGVRRSAGTSTGRAWPRRSAPGTGVEPHWSFGWRCFAANGLFAHGGYEPGGEYRRQLDELCHTLRERLAEGVSHRPRS